MLVDIQISLSSILRENKQFKKELDELKTSLQLSDIELRNTKTKLDEAAKANIKLEKRLHATTTSLDSARNDLREHFEEINYFKESLDNLEQYTRKNSLEFHGVPENSYESTEQAILKIAAALEVQAQKATIFCLQETYSSPEDEKVWSAEWGGNTLFSHGSSHSRGVCILLNPSNVTFCLQSVKQDSDGRLLIAKATVHDKSFFIVNIYAPTDYRDQDNFIRTLSEQLMSNTNISNVIIAGDWNTTLNSIDKLGGQPWKATNYRNSLVNLMDELNLIDIYRQIHPTTKSFSYESKPLNLKSRIDFFVISRSISSCVKNVEIRVSIAPDHKYS
ncbi:LINE-1 retrotransposable element ORF2 protein [Acropora cervicornis]|uniref:exodeoxyribonuclease III n=1 Tax=Acropora cervicornis TaxID=6130 RepID=A0AAD9V2P1_ACRCE|nr:LINE-1 retrotransposable element ORF2 protein [Acropora cervicornis]